MLQKLFGFDPAQNKLKTEVAAGITTLPHHGLYPGR